MITLYDFHTTVPGRGLSIFTWRIRLALNFKGIKHQTEWIQYADIKKRMIELGLPPTISPDNVGETYTVPAIFDSSTKVSIGDSQAILNYLNQTYPDTPQIVIPNNTGVLMAAFDSAVITMLSPIWPLTTPTVIANMSGESADKYRKRFEEALNTTVDAFVADKAKQEEYWAKAKETFDAADHWFSKASESASSDHGPWIMGKEFTVADLVLGSGLAWILTVVTEDSEEWRRISSWNDGRWAKYWNQIKLYSKVY